jgi:hypothetical protein
VGTEKQNTWVQRNKTRGYTETKDVGTEKKHVGTKQPMYNTVKREVPVDIFGHRTPGFGMMEVRFI